ncbi:unnamed protein product [Prunus brigantina]
MVAMDHEWREKDKEFDGNTERCLRPRVRSSDEILDQLNRLDFAPFGKTVSRIRPSTHINWTHKPMFFELPYWSRLKLRHNLDVMHVEKNVFDTLVGTILDIEDKTKDTIKARLDLERMGIRRGLWMNRDTFLPDTPSFFSVLLTLSYFFSSSSYFLSSMLTLCSSSFSLLCDADLVFSSPPLTATAISPAPPSPSTGLQSPHASELPALTNPAPAPALSLESLSFSEHVDQTTFCESTDIDFYGKLTTVVQLLYKDRYQVIMFKCRWFDTNTNRPGSIKIDHGLLSVNINRTWYDDDPYILANMATQIVYLDDPKAGSGWNVVQKMDHRNVYDILELDPTDNDVDNVADQHLESSMENDAETLRDTNVIQEPFQIQGVSSIEIPIQSITIDLGDLPRYDVREQNKAQVNKGNRKKTLLHHSGSRPFSYRMDAQRRESAS